MPEFFSAKLSQASTFIKEVFPQTADEAYQTAVQCGSHLWSATQTASNALAKVPDLIYNHFNPQNENGDYWYNTFSSYAKEGVDQVKYLNCHSTEFLKNSTTEKCPNPSTTFTAAELLIPGTVVLLSGKLALDNALGAISKTKTLILERRKEVHTVKLLLGITFNTALATAYSIVGASVGLGMHNKLNQEGVSQNYQMVGAGVMAAILTVPQLVGLIKNCTSSKPQAIIHRQPRAKQKTGKHKQPPKQTVNTNPPKNNDVTVSLNESKQVKPKETKTASKKEDKFSVLGSPSTNETKRPGSPPIAKKNSQHDKRQNMDRTDVTDLSHVHSVEENAFPGFPSPSAILLNGKSKPETTVKPESVSPPATKKTINNGSPSKTPWYNEGVKQKAYPRQGWVPTLSKTIEETDVLNPAGAISSAAVKELEQVPSLDSGTALLVRISVAW